ncbi:VWA domain-containing protein [Aquabacterium sp.]|uniref:nitric oxide reductase activation protein NorD n=1 Tax=Aquabacterium sp. TaxID=1872578 RepID=UPI0024888AAF|nr:VWA domain-containing protein [Aquabacterium sp.]MDI1260686.1 VWA domain-containing protein [Aquabacterium sp.]
MAEAEDVITDAARHATVFTRDLWRRHRAASGEPAPLRLSDVAQRLDLLIEAVWGHRFALRAAQPPAPPSWLARVIFPHRLPPGLEAVPATDDHSIWLPESFGQRGKFAEDTITASQRFRTMALLQAQRAERGSARHCPVNAPPLLRELYLVLEAHAADDALARLLPGMTAPLQTLRQEALARRPRLAMFPTPLQWIEGLVRAVLNTRIGQAMAPGAMPSGAPPLVLPASPVEVLDHARSWCEAFDGLSAPHLVGGQRLVWRDWWTGDLRAPPAPLRAACPPDSDHADGPDSAKPRSAHLARRPEVREAEDDEDEDDPHVGAWMVQTAQPHEKAEDPLGQQRPTDRDTTTAAEDFADALSELPEARLVSTPGQAKEVLLSDDPPESQRRQAWRGWKAPTEPALDRFHYPEWDWQIGAYRDPGATVLIRTASAGPQQWVEDTLTQRRGMLHDIRRRFELLRAQRVRVCRQLDGDDIDLQAYTEGHADFRAGLPLSQRLYQSERRGRRDMAIMLLIDVSGSTDGWIAPNRRVIDVEREALLLVCIALEGLADPYSVLAFSGEGPQGVVVRNIKRFDERYGDAVAQRIAGLEPEHYTRAGAAIRHASALLMGEPAQHRLLLLLSDGKPNDVDHYEGRHGVEDMRQAVSEAKLQGISPFCLTIDRQAPNYLPAVFGPHQYALLHRPELLPTVLLDWLRRLMGA